jgi:hypothetical protein
MDNQLEKQLRGRKNFSSPLMAQAKGETLLDFENLKQSLKDDESGKGGQSLVLKFQLWNFGGFAGDIFSATLHLTTFVVLVSVLVATHTIRQGRHFVDS